MATTKERDLGEILVEHSVISPLELDEALQRQRLTGEMLGRVLVGMDLCTEQDVVEALGVQQGMELVDVTKLSVSEDILRKLTPDIVRFYNCVPIRERDGALIVAMAQPLNIGILDDLAQIAGQEVRGAVSNMTDVQAFIGSNYSYETESIHQTLEELITHVGESDLSLEEMGVVEIVGDAENLVHLAQEPEVIQIVNLVLLEALTKRASDVHFEIFEEEFRIRIRIDGVLHKITDPPKALALALISRCKIMANMDISERRLPQDARIELRVGESDVDIRVSTLPTLYGENVVMRILDRASATHDLTKLGIDGDVLKKIELTIRKPNGIMLVTGPTGSGKTTTLYACLNKMNSVGVKIITTEDPVEIQIDRIIQVQVKEDIGLTFAACLRSILRQDPDIIMVGEIRDYETAQIAIESALTGHLVLSTLHTNSAPESITRLLDMDVEPFLITSSVLSVLAQRLLRRVCRHCGELYRPDDEEMEQLGLPDAWRVDSNLRFMRPKGCASCDFVGYKGRMAIHEMMMVDETVQDMVNARSMSYELRDYARKKQGMLCLREQGILKAAQHMTSAEEVLTHTDRIDEQGEEETGKEEQAGG
jgi:type IV pilus assembly protein PilB